MAPWDNINLQPLVAGEERLGGDESTIEEIGLKGDESSIEEIEVKGDNSSREVIEIKSDESCTEMAVKKTDEDNLNDAQPLEHESDECTIKRNKQHWLRTCIAVLKMNICWMRAEKLHMNLFSEDDEDLKSEMDTTGTTNTFTEENIDISTSTDLDYFRFKNSDDLTSKTYSANGTDVEQKPRKKKRKSLHWRCLRCREKSEESYYEDYDDNESVW